MEIGPRRGRLLFGFILFGVMFALAVVITVIELSEGRIRLLIALGIVLFPLLMAGFGMMLFRKPATLLTLSAEGIRFHLPAFGLVPWRDIGAAGILPVGLFRVRVFAIEIKPAVPRSNLLLVNLVGIGKKRIEGRERIFYALRQLDRSQAEIEAELARLRPALAAPPKQAAAGMRAS
jgi:hypothetical protein